MPTFFFPLSVLTQVFEDDCALSEALNFVEISRFDSKEERRNLAVRANAEEILKRADTLELHSRIAPPEFAASEICLLIDPPRNSKKWRHPVEIKIHFLHWQQVEGYFQAFVPSLGIAVICKDADQFEQKIEKEIRAALVRTGASKSLRKLRELERVREIRIEKSELAVELKTPKQRAIDENKVTEEESVLAEVSTKLNDKKLAPAYEVEQMVNRLAEMLSAKERYSILLIGANGIGKTAIFQEVVRQRAKLGFKDTSFYATTGARLVAGQTGFGMWQERCQKLAAEIKKQNAILHLGNLFELLEVGKSNSNSQGIASFFRPKIARGELQTIVECTPEQLVVIEKRDANLLTAFQQINVAEPNRETGLKILQSVANELAQNTSLSSREIETEAIKTLDAVHRRYATYSAFPGRPVSFLRNLSSNNTARTTADAWVTPKKVLQTFSEETGLPLFLLSDEEQLDLKQIENWFEQRVLGQTEAIKLIIDLIATVKAKLTRPRKPIASLLFIGATGVGKTELTKALAEFFFNNRERLVRFDMSEFSTPIAVGRLIGGFGETEGQLTAKIREQPFSVLLFDEFEKAHPQFFDLLLQILGEGRLTDASGRVADFTNSIIVMTSNLGAETFGRGRSGFLTNAREKHQAIKHFSQSVRDFLRPEIFNRLDRVVPFAPLDERTAQTITELEIENLKKREGFRFRQIKLSLEKEAVKFLAETGYDVRYGARPLRRAVERELLAPLAAELNQHLPEEKLTVSVRLENNNLKFAIETNVLQKKRSTTNFVLASLASRAAALRRNAQKLTSSSHLIELADEQFQLVRVKARSDIGRWVAPEDLTRLARLPKIQKFLAETKEFGLMTANLEDSILLDIYGKAETANDEFALQLGAGESRLQKNLLDLLTLKIEKSDETCLAIFSENASALFRMVRCYLICAEDFKCETPEIICFTTRRQKGGEPLEKPLLGREVWRQEIAEPEKFFASSAQKELVGAVIKITGALSNPRFAPESGVHSFVIGGATDKVLVISGDFLLAKVTPNEQLTARGAIDLQRKRRTYDANTNKIHDFALSKFFEFDGRTIADPVAKSIAENLQRTINSLLDN
ncbi:MAG: AAA family ATPase [Pyrinomonadaceae bacterium]